MYKWTQEQITILKNNYKKLGATKLHNTLLKDISISTIRTKARALGLNNLEYNWTNEETEAMLCFGSEHTTSELLELFPGRTRQSIKLKLARLGIKCLSDKRGGFLKPELPTTLYLVNFGEFFKVGITQNSIKIRLKNYPAYTIEWLVEELTLEKAKELEIDILETVDLFSPKGWLSGRTECFKAKHPPIKPIV